MLVPKRIIQENKTKNFSNGEAIFSTNLETISTLKRLEEVRDIVANVIVKWNCNKYYKDTPIDRIK
jgi:hypothetical protein